MTKLFSLFGLVLLSGSALADADGVFNCTIQSIIPAKSSSNVLAVEYKEISVPVFVSVPTDFSEIAFATKDDSIRLWGGIDYCTGPSIELWAKDGNFITSKAISPETRTVAFNIDFRRNSTRPERRKKEMIIRADCTLTRTKEMAPQPRLCDGMGR
jgi:hypothetical protein